MNHPWMLNQNRCRCFEAASACGLVIFEISQMDAMRCVGSCKRKWRERERTIMQVNPQLRRQLVTRKSDLVEKREVFRSATMVGWYVGGLVHLHCLGLCELLGCNIIVFDAVILQCRAYIHASAARGHIRYIRGAKCRDNCRAFPPSPCSPSQFFCFLDVIPRCTTGFHRRGRKPSAKSHVLSITSTRNTSRCSNQRLVLTFSLRNHLPRAVFMSRWKSHDSFEIAKRGIYFAP